MVEVNTNEINTHFLIYELFEGNANKALKVARRFSQSKFTLTPKSIERYMIVEYIKTGLTDEDIIEALSDEDNKILPKRLERLRQEIKDGKYN